MDLKDVRTLAGQLEAAATDVVARLAPWIAPLPTAFLVGRATIRHLGWPTPVGVVAALVVETLGLSTTSTALVLRDYNKSKRKSDPSAPFAFSAALVGVYLLTALGLTVLLEGNPVLAIFPLLSLCGVTVLALRSDHERRVRAVAQDKQERRKARQEAAKERARVKQEVERRAQELERARKEAASETQERRKVVASLGKAVETLALLAANPAQSQSKLAQELGISRQAVGQHLNKLEKAGAIDRDNGTVEVLWEAVDLSA